MDQFSKKILAASIVLAFGFAGNAWAADAVPLANAADSAAVKGDGSQASTANGNTNTADSN
ncbi:hypothetical protein ABO04_00005, partial [Nitrosomonas sp. HPC101]|nr:hypothetical protein [Nitrosomonas sp. HPC101]